MEGFNKQMMPEAEDRRSAPAEQQASQGSCAAAFGSQQAPVTQSGIPWGNPRESVPESLRPGRHHVHHTYIWLGGIRAAISTVVAIVVVAFGNLIGTFARSEASDAADAAAFSLFMPLVFAAVIVFIVLIVGIIFLAQWLSWKNLTYELGPDEFSLNSGIISKKRMHVPYQRVQAVNQQAGLFQRLVGVCNVKIDTAGGATNDGVILQYMRASEAEALRSELFRRKKALLAGAAIGEDGTAVLGGVPYYSAWAVATLGYAPQSLPQAALGYVFQSAPFATGSAATSAPAADGVISGAPLGCPASPAAAIAASGETNVLDVADEVLHDVRGVFGGDEVDTGRVRFETGLSNKELLLAGASGAGEGLGLLFVGIAAAVGTAAQVFQGAIEDFAEDWLVSSVGSIGASATMSGIDAFGAAIGGAAMQIILWALLTVAALWVIAALGTVVHYGGFRLRRREGRVEVESGLLSRSFHGVDVDRVQSVVIKQSLIRRLMGYCELSVAKIDSATPADSSGANGQQQVAKGVVIHPFVKVSRVPEIIQGVLPEFSDMPPESVGPAPVALRRAIFRMAVIRSSAFWFAVFVALCQIGVEVGIRLLPVGSEALGLLAVLRSLMMAYYVVFVLAFIYNVVNAVLWHRDSGLGYDRDFMSMTNGGLSTVSTYTPRKKIQFAYLRTNPFQRMAHVASVNVRTAAGIGGTTETLWDLSEQDADAWMEWVRPRGRKA